MKLLKIIKILKLCPEFGRKNTNKLNKINLSNSKMLDNKKKPPSNNYQETTVLKNLDYKTKSQDLVMHYLIKKEN